MISLCAPRSGVLHRLLLAVGLGVVTACAAPAPLPVVAVKGMDYAFTAPDTVAAGETVFAFENVGQMLHEVKVIGLHAGVSLAEIVRLDQADSGWRHLTDQTSGILVARAGTTTPGRLLVHLEAGRTYLLVCGFQDTDESPVHSQLGMIRALHVR